MLNQVQILQLMLLSVPWKYDDNCELFSWFPETANFVNVLFDALTNSSYMPQVMVEPTVAPIPVPAPQVVMPITPAPSPVKAQERPRKTSVTEDVLTARVQEEVRIKKR